jgi:pimeloyl-ACP methyl ester carboxylesterase
MSEPIVDHLEQGAGPTVVLIHSSVAGAGQWRRLMDDLSDQFHLIAINLYGYGGTDAWTMPRDQTLQDQAELLHAILPDQEHRFSIVGHSFGGSVAMKAAALFGERVERLVLIEPNPFYLLEQDDRLDAFAEAKSLRDCIKENGGKEDWETAAAVFADYWTGDGSWGAMPQERRVKFAQALKPNFHEWDAVMNESIPVSEWVSKLPKQTTVISASDTVNSIAQIVDLMKQACTDWRFEELERGGHMAALTQPDKLNPIVRAALV